MAKKILTPASRFKAQFDSYDEMQANIDDPDLDVDADSVIVLRNAGPVGAGMPEWGQLPIPQKLLEHGVRDMLRISDARMSGTSYGACVLHVAPESFVGGPLALLKTGDLIKLDVEARSLDMLVSEDDLDARRAGRLCLRHRSVGGVPCPGDAESLAAQARDYAYYR